MKYETQEELYKFLRGAFNVKMHMNRDCYQNVKIIDIWNYLKINKWSKDKDLNISEMVEDIMNVDMLKVSDFINKNSQKNNKKMYVE